MREAQEAYEHKERLARENAILENPNEAAAAPEAFVQVNNPVKTLQLKQVEPAPSEDSTDSSEESRVENSSISSTPKKVIIRSGSRLGEHVTEETTTDTVVDLQVQKVDDFLENRS